MAQNIKVRFGVGNEATKPYDTVANILEDMGLLEFLGTPDNVEARISGVRVDGNYQLHDGEVIDLMTVANEKG